MFHSSSYRRASLPGALLVLAAAVPVHAATLRVKTDAPGPTHDGQTWQTAYTTVSSAIGAASALDEVWVAAGTYKDAITLKSGVSLYGGFNGNEATRDARNPRANETILDGEGASRVVYAPPGIGNDTTLDGFTIRNGTANTNPENGYGGGILCDQSGPNIVNNRITGCTATNGGAITVKGAPAILLQGNVIEANTGGNPGVYLLDSTATLDGNTITGNRGIVTAPSSAGGVYCGGGEVNLSRCVIRGNAAYWSPTGAGAGGIVVAGDGSAVISSCLITDNTGLVGGLSAVNTRLESSLVAGNVGTSGAGGVSASACALVNDTIAANSDNGVGAVVFHGSGSRLHNTIIAFNAAGLAGVLSTSGAFSLSQSNNCVFGNAAFDYSGLASGSQPSSDPRFVNVAAGNFHIQPDSPCKDAGRFDLAPTGVDMDGEPRSQGRTVDIGADESDGTVWSAIPTVMHVRPDGSDAADGLTWQTAKQTPQAAVDALTGSGGEVWVAEGTYGPPTDEDAVVTLSSFVALYGGFTGDETARGERDWRAHRTVIDGNATHMGFHIFGGYRVTAVDGFTVTNTDNRGGWAGAAVMCAPMSAPIIAHNRLSGNRMGRLSPHPPNSAAALAVGGPALIAGNVITDNISDASGIGWYGGSPLIRNNTVVGNSGADGAAVHLEGQLPGAPLFVNNIFAHNTSGFFAPFHLAQLPDFRNNCIFDNGEGFVNIPDPTGSAGNIAADPLLADFEMGDNHLSAASPCLDADEEFTGAAEALDMDGESRRIGAHVDIGADEFSGLIPVPARHIVRVKTDGSDDADGSTWASGVKTIQHAVDLAAQTGGEVWVAAGEYAETVVLAPHVYLYGGFVGSETRRRDRNSDGRATTIHPRAKGSAITATDLGVYAGVDGFVVAGGWTDTMGGGIFSLNSSPTIANNFIRSNHA